MKLWFKLFLPVSGFALFYMLFIYNDGHFMGLVLNLIGTYIQANIQEFIGRLFGSGI